MTREIILSILEAEGADAKGGALSFRDDRDVSVFVSAPGELLNVARVVRVELKDKFCCRAADRQGRALRLRLRGCPRLQVRDGDQRQGSLRRLRPLDARMRARGGLLLPLAAVAACGSNGALAQTDEPTDVTFDVEPLALPLPDGGTAPAGERFVIDLVVGAAPPIRAILDTGSSGVTIAPDAPAQTLAALTSRTGETFSTTYGSGVTATGFVARARVTLGGRATADPIGVAVVQTVAGGVAGAALQQLFNGYSAIVGIGMRNASATLGNPIVQLAGHPPFVIEAPDFGGTTGTLRIGALGADGARFISLSVPPAPAAIPRLADGTPAWLDDDLPGCVADATTRTQLCGPTLLDTGDPAVYLYWPGYSGPGIFPAGTLVDFEVGNVGPPLDTLAITVGATPQPGLDVVTVVTSTQGHISLGTLIFHRFDVLFDQVRGVVALAPHASVTPVSADAAVPACDDTYDCAAGQTCWTADGVSWTCLPAGAGALGSTCDPSTSAVSCGDRMACVGNGATPPVGTCRLWCDAGDPCPAGAGTCTTIRTATTGAALSFCM